MLEKLLTRILRHTGHQVNRRRLFSSRTFRVALAAFVAIVSWASAWVSIRAAIGAYSPGQLALGRYLVAALVLLPWWIKRRPHFERRDLLPIVVSGACGFSLYNLCINAGEQTISAGAAALVASIIPVLVTLGARVLWAQPVSRRAVFGSCVAIGGVLLLALGSKDGVRLSPGALLVVLASCGAAVYQLIQIGLRPRYGALDLTTAAIFAGTLLLVPFGSGLVGAVQHAPLPATLNLVLLGAFPGALGYVLWSWVVSQGSVARVMSLLFLISPLAVLMGWAFLGELPSELELVGGALALGGVVWCQTEPKAK